MTGSIRKPRRSPADNPFPDGFKIGAVQILFLVHDAPVAHQRRWWVRYACCGLETDRAYPTLSSFLPDPPSHCRRCAHALNIARRDLPRPRPRAAFTPARAWPRPASRPGNRHSSMEPNR